MRMRPLWRQMGALDERGLESLRDGLQIQHWIHGGQKGSMPKSRIPPRLPLTIRVEAGRFEASPVGDTDQIALGQTINAVAGIGWRVVPDRRHLSWRSLQFHLDLHGRAALRPGYRWLMVRYRNPLVVRREDQQYKAGFDALCARIGAGQTRTFDVSEFFALSRDCIIPILEGSDASQFFWNFLK